MPTRKAGIAWLLTAVGMAAVAGAFAPKLRAQESIKIDVNLVNVAFSVRDASGALVDGLTQDDFEVLEDSAPQKIAYFAKSTDLPLTLGLDVDASGSQDHFENNTNAISTHSSKPHSVRTTAHFSLASATTSASSPISPAPALKCCSSGRPTLKSRRISPS